MFCRVNTQLVINKFSLVSMATVVEILDWSEDCSVSSSLMTFFFELGWEGGGKGVVGVCWREWSGVYCG